MFIIGILVSIILPQFSKMKENQTLKNAVNDITSSINNARSQSLASVGSSEYGVHLETDKIIIFKGKVFSISAVDNNVIDIIPPANISNVILSGVSSSEGDFYFERLTAIPSKTGTIIISTSSNSKTITISPTGAISIN
ncbi:MAG: hypothetical protein WC577_02105 [Candidatus Paceibacterota bacterium]